MSVDTITINTTILLKSGLTVEQYFILECIYRDNIELLIEYVQSYGLFGKSAFDKLVEMGVIVPIAGDISSDKLKLTKYGIDLLGHKEKLDYEQLFSELREVYPKKCGERRLHQDIPGCKKTYKKIVDSVELHQKILSCVELYVKELKDSGRMQYIQLLPTFLNQRNYLQYLEEVDKAGPATTKEEYGAI